MQLQMSCNKNRIIRHPAEMDARVSRLPPDVSPEAANADGWRADAAADVQRSLPEVYGSVSVPRGGHWSRRLLAFAGPGYLVAVGYMDPGNWATDLAGGVEVRLHAAVGHPALEPDGDPAAVAGARLGIVTGRDLAQACRDHFSAAGHLLLWLSARSAIIASDLAEVIGTAIALKLLFGIPLVGGALITALDAVPAAAPDEPRLSLARGLRDGAADRHRGLLCRPDRRRRAAGRGDAARLRAVHRRSLPIPRCSTSPSASSARR